MELLNNWYEEKRSAYLYAVMAEKETNLLHRKLFLELKAAAEKQAHLWESKLQAANITIPAFVPDRRTKLVAMLVRLFGAERLHNILSAMKIRGMSVFTRYHSEHRHTNLNASSNLRAAVFGINDGLVSNMSLILGLVGAHTNTPFIVLASVAGLLAGACSMAAGEYISVRSQREVFEYQIAIEKRELEEYPEEEREELSLIYQARGMPQAEAEKLAQILISNPDTGLDALAREELGLNPEDMVSPIGAMISSFLSFAVGAFIPIVPFLFIRSIYDPAISMFLTAFALFSTGAVLSLFTNKNPWISGLRMLLIGFMAGLVTFIIGSWLGA